MLEDACERIEIAGSVRREKATVGDIEMVAIPRYDGALNVLHKQLDYLVEVRWMTKARVGEKMQTRWGDLYRAFVVDGVKFDLFMADEHNWGYQFWLRTGPNDANLFVMDAVKRWGAPYQAIDGYWRAGGHKISVPDEETMYRLLGIEEIIPPGQRTLERMQQRMIPPKWALPESLEYVSDEAPVQGTLF